MNWKKPAPLATTEPAGAMCPVCGKRSYSRDGIHPQCAVKQADAPRQLLLAEEKRERVRQAVIVANEHVVNGTEPSLAARRSPRYPS